jgi:hypothetical protein
MKGYKVFNPNWKCLGFQYEVGKSYEMDELPICCDTGFHFCKNLSDCFNYYTFNSQNKAAEIEAYGEIDTNDNNKYCTNKIKIVRELSWEEVLKLANTGVNNNGYANVGNANDGDHNVGDSNVGVENTGCHNNGKLNSGNFNIGDANTGSHNSGYSNTGCRNKGTFNTGHHNIGDRNTGNFNYGDNNVGDWNISNSSTGVFNTDEEELKIFMFNKPSNMTLKDWKISDARFIMNFCPHNYVEWISEYYMSDKEKTENPSYKTTGGYLKVEVPKNSPQKWWNNLPKMKKNIVMGLPNFDADIFKKITGIEVRKEKQ